MSISELLKLNLAKESDSSNSKGTLLVIEDDPLQVDLFSAVLEEYRLIPVSTISAGLEVLRHHSPDVILMDHILGDGQRGADHVHRLKKAAPQVPVVIISGTLGIREQLGALQGGLSADFVLEKPVDIKQLIQTVERARSECGLPAAIQLLQSVEAASTRDEAEPPSRYVDRLKRMQRLQIRLREVNDRPNISGLAREFGVSRRTIIRDVRDLIQLGQFDSELYPEWNRPWVRFNPHGRTPKAEPAGGPALGSDSSPSADEEVEPS
jgi:DNA-binding NtrC family response regulator